MRKQSVFSKGKNSKILKTTKSQIIEEKQQSTHGMRIN